MERGRKEREADREEEKKKETEDRGRNVFQRQL